MSKSRSTFGLILLAYIAFIALGLPDGLLGVAWPSIRSDFNVPLDAMGLLFIFGTAGYNISSFFSGSLLRRVGVGGLLALSCAATGLTLISYTLAPGWWVFVALGLVAGLGAGAIDAGINTFVASNFGEGIMQWLHASWGIGVTLGPLIMTTALNLFNNWRIGYAVVGSIQLILAATFAISIPVWKRQKSTSEQRKITDYKTPLLETLKQPGAWFSILLFLVYSGCEITVGSWIYTLLTESRQIAPEIAGLLAGSYWGTFTVGRILAGLVTRKIGVRRLLTGSLLLALTGTLLLWWNPVTWVSLAGVGVIGLSIAPIFPGMVSTTEDRVGHRHTANTIGMQISAAGMGAALLPGLAGVLARRIDLEVIPVQLVVMFSLLLIIFVAAKRRNNQNQEEERVRV